MRTSMKAQEHILSLKQRAVLSQMSFLADTALFMGGGTALALQLGHRTSEDFDLYSREKFDVGEMRNLFLEKAPGVLVLSEHKDGTLQLSVDDVDVSVFYYPYRLIDKLVEFYPVKLASLEDIAASKVAAVVQRARQRDFIDIYYLSQRIGFDQVIECAFQKFPWYRESSGIVFKSLTYFSEADTDAEAERIKVFDERVTWGKVKNYLEVEVKNYLSLNPA